MATVIYPEPPDGWVTRYTKKEVRLGGIRARQPGGRIIAKGNRFDRHKAEE